VSPDVLKSLREAGRVAALVRDRGATRIVPGLRLRDLCESVEDEIRHHGALPAFPTQSSRNHIAAHYCPSPEDETVYAKGDLAKLDIGVHVDGYVVDTAVTVDLSEQADDHRLVEGARAALEAAIASIRPGVEIRGVSQVIEETLRSFGARPMRNLCGHGVARWTVHCPPPIPNAPDVSEGRLGLEAVVAVEPFATRGLGFVKEMGSPEVFRLPEETTVRDTDVELLETIRGFHGLPFSRRQLARFGGGRVDEGLARLNKLGALKSYPPLAEGSGQVVAQAEHTLLVRADGVEVLTR
jgi:methionyl aminopeptidase